MPCVPLLFRFLQHGVATGYYITFLFGGFVQTIGRLCRSHLRPLFLPADYVTARGAPPPPQTPLKTAYDAAGTLATVLVLNYIVTPFMLLTWADSRAGWAALGWYGNYVVFGALAFFYLGGTRVLRHVQAARAKRAGVRTEKMADGSVKTTVNGSISGAATPARAQTLPPLDDVAQEVENTEFMRKFNK